MNKALFSSTFGSHHMKDAGCRTFLDIYADGFNNGVDITRSRKITSPIAGFNVHTRETPKNYLYDFNYEERTRDLDHFLFEAMRPMHSSKTNYKPLKHLIIEQP